MGDVKVLENQQEEQETEGTGTGIYRLKTPIRVNGEEKLTEELPYDLEAITGNDIVKVKKLLQSKGFMETTFSSFDSVYLLHLFGRAVELATKQKIALTDVCGMKARDVEAVVMLTRLFLNGGEESSPPEQS